MDGPSGLTVRKANLVDRISIKEYYVSAIVKIVHDDMKENRCVLSVAVVSWSWLKLSRTLFICQEVVI